MSQFPPLKAPDGFELGVFSRMMLSDLPNAPAPSTFEADVMQKVNVEQVPKVAQPLFKRSFNWKTGIASVALLLSVTSVTWFTGALDSYFGTPEVAATTAGQTVQQTQATSTPAAQPAPVDIRKADASQKRETVKRGRGAVNNSANKIRTVRAGY